MSAPANQGRVTTFYSYKGGTGRTMMLANCAWQLAEAGRHVLMVDWDLEAPGLHRYFSPFLADPELASTDGLMDLVTAYAAAAVDTGRDPEAGDGWVDEHADILSHAIGLDWNFPSGGSLTLMPSGRQGASYATGVNTFDWKHFYERLGGFGFLERVRAQMVRHFDEVLIDSRTGISDTAGISTVQLPHQLVVCFTLNNQSIGGAAGVARSVLQGHGELLAGIRAEHEAQRAAGYPGIAEDRRLELDRRSAENPLCVWPLAMRIEPSESERLRQRWDLAQQRFTGLLDHLPPQRRASYWHAAQVPYIPLVAYEEVLAAVANLPSDPKSTNMLGCVQSVVQEVFGVSPLAPSLTPADRERLLRAFASGTQVAPATPDAPPSTQALEVESRRRAETLAQRRSAEPTRRRDTFGRRPHAFVAMPFGVKPGHDGYPIDFDRVYQELFAPALEAAGFEPFRADQEMQAGDIRADMFQELLVADLVLVDLTLDNPNVWYELGVRHALRARGVVLALGPRPYQPFDIYSDRKLRYSLRDGAPDHTTLAVDRERLTMMLRETLQSSTQRVVSPVYALLPHLREPQWRDLLLEGPNEFGDAQRAWSDRVAVARRKGRAGDILVLADETPTRALRLEGKLAAGNSLIALGQPELALEQFDQAIAIDPLPQARSRRVVALTAIGRYDEARTEARRLVTEKPASAEYRGLAGRVAKDRWIEAWRAPGKTRRELIKDAVYAAALLEDAVEQYRQGFNLEPSSYYAGINILTLATLAKHMRVFIRLPEASQLEGAVRWACDAELARSPRMYWALVTQAELALLTSKSDTETLSAYRRACAAADGDQFALQSSLRTLQLLADLSFRPELVRAVSAVLQRELDRLAMVTKRPARQVLVFSGHMIDSPNRVKSRFPPSKQEAAERAIAEALDNLEAGPEDMAFTQGAAGGDLLFAHQCLLRGVRVQLMLPLPEAEFIQQSVLPSAQGNLWQQAFFSVKSRLAEPPLEMPVELGPAPPGISVFERCNLWMLNTALSLGPEKLRLVCLWDGSGGDGPGGTQHMVQEAKRRTGRVHWIDVNNLEEENP